MHISSLDLMRNGIGGLSRRSDKLGADDSSIFNADIDAQTVANMLNKGMDKNKIVENLVNTVATSNDNELLSVLKTKIEHFVNYVQFQIFKNQSQETELPLNDTPVNEDEQDWDLSQSGNMFTVNITQESFINEFNFLTEQAGESGSPFLNAINQIGAENFFAAIDTNGDGTLDNSELDSLINADGNNTSISAVEFNNAFYQYLGTAGIGESETPAVPETPTVTGPTGAEGTDTGNKTKKSSKKTHHTSTDSSDSNPKPEEKKDTVEDLMKQKQDIISETDTKISTLNQEIADLIANSDADDKLKEEYNTAKEAYDTNENTIKENEKQIQDYDKDLHNIEKSLAALNGEYSTLQTNTSDEEVNQKNAARKTEIEKQIKELESKKQEIESKKHELVEKNKILSDNSTNLKTALDNAFNALQSVLSEDIKGKIAEIQNQIQTLESTKNKEVSEIDAKITALKADEIKDSRESGEATGKFASNPIGAKFIELAMKYKGYKENSDGSSMFSTGDYGWCADFVTYVVKTVAENLGMSKDEVKNLRHNHLGASPQKLANKNKGHVISTSQYSSAQLQGMIKPGMAFICKGSGASGQHTGFVAAVNDDGTFVTIEGNSNNMVRQQTRNIKDMYSFVDFTYLFA